MSQESENLEQKQEKDKESIESFYVKMPDMPQVGSAEATQAEQQLLAHLKSRGPRAETLKPLVVFYSRVGQQERAYQYLKMWMKYTKNRDELAESLMMSGQLAEQVGQPEPAISFYREALLQHSEDYKINYYIHNNLAYCLNTQGEPEKAIKHCDAAIKLDPSRANAFKNLGVSLSGLGKYAEAANMWLKATHVDVSDSRALDQLEKLVAKQREAIVPDIPDIDDKLKACRRAVESAKTGRFADWARGLTLN
ncbi:tetratricopeptide repeat protein [bacterium]|nr:tetratricopeptide repeat protein [bacterium]